jgi:hypothetical protein
VDTVTVRIVFFVCALILSPLLVWLAREAIYELDGTTGWIWALGLPSLITILAGGLLRRTLWELVLGASLSAGVAVLSLYVTIFVACQGKSDCL